MEWGSYLWSDNLVEYVIYFFIFYQFEIRTLTQIKILMYFTCVDWIYKFIIDMPFGAWINLGVEGKLVPDKCHRKESRLHSKTRNVNETQVHV